MSTTAMMDVIEVIMMAMVEMIDTDVIGVVADGIEIDYLIVVRDDFTNKAVPEFTETRVANPVPTIDLKPNTLVCPPLFEGFCSNAAPMLHTWTYAHPMERVKGERSECAALKALEARIDVC